MEDKELLITLDRTPHERIDELKRVEVDELSEVEEALVAGGVVVIGGTVAGSEEVTETDDGNESDELLLTKLQNCRASASVELRSVGHDPEMQPTRASVKFRLRNGHAIRDQAHFGQKQNTSVKLEHPVAPTARDKQSATVKVRLEISWGFRLFHIKNAPQGETVFRGGKADALIVELELDDALTLLVSEDDVGKRLVALGNSLGGACDGRSETWASTARIIHERMANMRRWYEEKNMTGESSRVTFVKRGKTARRGRVAQPAPDESVPQVRTPQSQDPHCAALKLPAEILSDIFNRTSLSSEPRNAYSWMAVSWVCRHWRQVALNHASLWSTIIVKNLRFGRQLYDLLLERSTNSPITVCALLDDNNAFSDFAPRLRKHKDRLKCLHAVGSAKNLTKYLPLFQGAPLKSLSVACPQPFNALGIPYELNDVPFLSAVDGMTSLSLTDCAFAWDSSVLASGLTSLELRQLPNRLSLPKIVKLLRRFPQLSRLSLEGVIKKSKKPCEMSLDVTLQHLSELNLYESESTCVAFLEHVHFPTLSIFDLSYHSDGLGVASISTTAPKVLRLAAPSLPSLPPFTELRLSLGFNNKCSSWGKFSLGSDTRRVATIETCPKHPVDMSLGALFSTAVKFPSWMEHISFLECDGAGDSNPSLGLLRRSYWNWSNLTALPSLRTIRIKTYRPPGLFEVLFEKTMSRIDIGLLTGVSSSTDPTALQPNIPVLETIVFERFTFENVLSETCHGNLAMIDLLTAYLWASKELCGSCPRIVIKGCKGVDERWLEGFRSYTDVEWDGSTGNAYEYAHDWCSAFSSVNLSICSRYIDWFKATGLSG
ncbi:hypothetical protein ONZ45_g15150 [Pleurotus djamor]|nr:hypothetical protein ONZ45_g15150 [Pleurotus djamor]